MLSYRKIFKPGKTEKFTPSGLKKASGQQDQYAGDRRDGLVYVYDNDIILAVNVALSVKRPLLIRGASGSGKSSLALNIARFFKWRYYEVVISSGTQARDLLWQFDTLRRLSDAQAGLGVKDDVHYIEPGVGFGWAAEDLAQRLASPTGNSSPWRQDYGNPHFARQGFVERRPQIHLESISRLG